MAVVLPLVCLLLSWHRYDWEFGRSHTRRSRKKKRRKKGKRLNSEIPAVSAARAVPESAGEFQSELSHPNQEEDEIEDGQDDEDSAIPLMSESYEELEGPSSTTAFLLLSFVLVACFLGYRYFMLGGMGLNGQYPAETIALNVMTMTRLWWFNVANAVWPWNPSIADTWTVSTEQGTWELLSLAGAVLWLVALLALRFRKQGWMLWWFTVWMLPTSGLIPLRHWRAERYLYPASFGMILFAVMFVYSIPMLRPRWKRNRITFRKSLRSKERYTIRTVLITMSFAMTIWAGWQNNYWFNDRKLFAHAIQQEPRYREGLFALASLELQEKEFDQSIETFRQLFQAADDPSFVSYWIPWRAHSNFGLALYYDQQYPEAYEQMQQALELRPDDPILHYHLGLIAQAQNQADLAAQHYRDCLEIVPNDPLAAGNLASLKITQGKLKEAARILQPLMETSSENSTNRYNYASVLLGLGQYQEALLQLKRLEEQHPKDYLVRAKLAWSLFELGKESEARKELSLAQKQKPRHPLILFVEHKLNRKTIPRNDSITVRPESE